MKSRVLQDWTTVSASASPFSLIQSAADWVDCTDWQDAGFLVEVRYASGTSLPLAIETSPAADNRFFIRVSAPLDLVPTVGGSGLINALATNTGPAPLAKCVRWAIYGSASWSACFRITMFEL